MTPQDRSDTIAVTKYTLLLGEWLASQGLPTQSDTAPLEGSWLLSNGQGRLVVKDNAFTWYKEPQGEDGDAFRGSCAVLQGLQTAAGFIVDRGPDHTKCFSVVLHNKSVTIDGAERPMDSFTLLFVEQTGSESSLGIYNHRTDARFTAHLVTG